MEEINRQSSATTATYDSALKQLVNILKSKSADNLKQLEDLWDSINYAVDSTSSKSTKGTRASPTPSTSSQSPITSMSDNSNDSNSSTSSNLKRAYPKTASHLDARDLAKKSKQETANMRKPMKPKIETDCSMLDDFTCVICKHFNQELNNKLVECRKCTSLYHQLCHIPRIRDEEIDEKDIEECAACKNETNSSDTDAELITSSSKPTQPVRVKSPEAFIFTNLSNNNPASTGVDKKPTVSSTNGVKGLASLASKFGSGAESKAATKPVIKSPEPAKPAGELFKKAKPTTLSSISTSSNSSKLKSSSSLLSNGSSIQKKSGLFNLSNGVKSSFTSGLKEKKHLNGSGGIGKLDIQSNAPSITNSIARSKIS